MQVSTPSWPASGSKKFPRKSDGNTLGCVKDDDVEVSQHFFSLKLTKDDTVKVLQALAERERRDRSGQSADRAERRARRHPGSWSSNSGKKSKSKVPLTLTLSSGVGLISKPSSLNVPPWQMVSSLLNGVPLRTATWWARRKSPRPRPRPASAAGIRVSGRPARSRSRPPANGAARRSA